ncbi:MAG: flagellar filament capping protein FliD [Oscillibacter sp.]|nr:flagellar filament capping protein FliD [Oscillibacter sp.]
MASVSRLSSSASSIYGNRNVLTGLASGLDTETMIENAISAYKTKISTLEQKRTKTEWKQEAYRNIIDKMSVFSDKYTSYNSSTNLTSTTFFNQAVRTIAQGENAAKIAASGRTTSNVSINGVKQLATAAKYTISGNKLNGNLSSSADGKEISAVSTGSFSLDGPMTLSTLTGSMTLAYGGSKDRSYLKVRFDETQVFEDDPPGTQNGKTAAEKLADEINKQLSEQTITIGGTTYTGEDLLNNIVKAEVGLNGVIGFTDPKRNGVFVSSATQDVQDVLLGGEKPGEDVTKLNGIYKNGVDSLKNVQEDAVNYLSENAPLTITLDGATKTINLPTKDELLASLEEMNKNSAIPYFNELKQKIKDNEPLNSAASRDIRDAAYANALQKKIDNAFGTGKLTVSDNMADSANGDNGLQLKFTAKEGSTFQITSSKNSTLGLGDTGTTSYLNTETKLGDLVDLDDESMAIRKKDENGDDIFSIVDGKKVYEYETDDAGNTLYSFKVNGVEVGQYTKDTTLGTILNNINSNKAAGVTTSYSKTTNELLLTARNTGETEKMEFEGLSAVLFGDPSSGDKGTFIQGQDAIFTATVNGREIEMTRSSNTMDIDGMSVTFKGTFGYVDDKNNPLTDEDGNPVLDANGDPVYAKKLDRTTEAVTFETSADADKIVDAIKSMVEDYNAIVTEIKKAYSTLPEQRTSGAYYEPLTDEDKEGMSESAIQAWEEKAKIGLLFGDNDLSQLYSRMTKAISMYGQNMEDLKAAGITTTYANGLTTLKFDEQTLRDTLESDPDRVRDIFTSSDGIMQSIKVPLEQYGKTTGGKGILVDLAGSVLAPSTLYSNKIYNQLVGIDEEIAKWQNKMSDQVDYYTTMFSKLEQLVSQMNSQSSYFSQLSGGY